MGLRRGAFSTLAIALLVQACVLSIEPVIGESDAIDDQRLPGSWEEVSGSDRATVTRSAPGSYVIDYHTGGRTERYNARLGMLGNRKILDVWPARDSTQPFAASLIDGHMLFSIDLAANEVKVAALNSDTAAAALRSGRLKLDHTENEGRVVLFGGKARLVAALGPYVLSSAAFERADVFRRSSANASAMTSVDPACYEASAWHEADALFHRDPHWLGADVASSVDLGGGRTLWLFGDTWIDPSGAGSRRGAQMVSNTVGVQRGGDPSVAEMQFYWGTDSSGHPAPVFPDRGREAFWFGSGVRVEDRLVLFFARTLRGTGTGLGFEHVGWTAVMVENPDAEPSAWSVRQLDTPANALGVLVGFAASLRLGDYVYAFGSQNPVKTHPIFAVRWPSARVRQGDLRAPEWWGGELAGWIPDSTSTQRWPLFEHAQSELTLHFDAAAQRFVAVHTLGFGAADVVMRAAPALTGPWSAARMVYRPPEYHRRNVMIYAGKAHPHLTGADLVLTYATNTFVFAEHGTDSLIYYPRFVRLTRCR